MPNRVPGLINYGTSRIIQVVNVETGAVATGTTTIPVDDTIPQNTEGTQFMTLAITPTDASNFLKIDVVMSLGQSAAPEWTVGALFQDSTADALAAILQYLTTVGAAVIISFTHYMVAGTTTATTFKVRAGLRTAGTVTFNGFSGARKLGGRMASSITITEIKA